jgi:hypothetical protein
MKIAISIGSVMVKWQLLPYISILQHPYYIALINNDKELYKNSISVSQRQSSKPSAKWSYLMSLKNNIQINGYDKFADPVILKKIDGKWCCTHGRHRMCILLSLYGPKLKLVCKIDETHVHVTNIQINKPEDKKQKELKVKKKKCNCSKHHHK